MIMFPLELNDYKRIEKLNTLHCLETFWDDVRKLTKRVTSDHSIRRWQCLAEQREYELLAGKVKKYALYQCDIEKEYCFRSWKHAEKPFNKDDYKAVYEGTIEGKDDIKKLERLFEIFNLYHPMGYKGRSMSTSDVIVLEFDDDPVAYYCDSFGWVDVSEQFL